MSLINQALKKEQQRRSLNLKREPLDITAVDPQPLTASQVAHRDQAKKPLKLLIGFSGLGAFLLVCGGAFIYFGKAYLSTLQPTTTIAASSEVPEIPQSPPVARTPIAQVHEILDAQAEKAANAEAIAAATNNAETEPATIVESTPPENPEPESVVSDDALIPESIGPQFSAEAQTVLDEFQIHGFRSAGANSRLLMNGRVYKIGDMVNNEFGLRFVGASEGALVFQDASGYRYEKPL